MKDILNTKWMRRVLAALAGLVIFFFAFSLGISIGYEKGMFASRWGRDYAMNFLGPPMGGMMPGLPGGDAHGAAGTVLSVASTTFAIKDSENNEQSIAVASGTVIKKMNSTIVLGEIAVGDHVVVIGAPNASGQVQARFVRVFPASVPGMSPGGAPLWP